MIIIWCVQIQPARPHYYIGFHLILLIVCKCTLQTHPSLQKTRTEHNVSYKVAFPTAFEVPQTISCSKDVQLLLFKLVSFESWILVARIDKYYASKGWANIFSTVFVS